MKLKILFMLLLILLNLNFILAEEFGYNLLESGKDLSPSVNLSTKSVNVTEFWRTSIGDLDNVNEISAQNLKDGDFGSNAITTSGTYNNLSIIQSGDWIYLSGDGSIEEGLDIAIPKYAGRDFYYGYGGAEDHHFGIASALTIYSNGNLITTGTGDFGKLVVDTDTLVVNAASYGDRVGIGTATPSTRFDINLPVTQYGTSFWSQSGLGQYTGARVNDGLFAVAFHTDSAGVGSYLHLDAGSAVAFTRVDISVSRTVTAIWNVQYSDNDSDWDNAYVGADVSGAEFGGKTFPFLWTSVGAHRYWRLYKTNAASGGNYHTEIQFFTNSDNLFQAQTSTGTGIVFPTVGGVQIKQEGVVQYTIGNDPADSNKFKVSTTDIYTNPRLVIDSSGRVAFGTSGYTNNPSLFSLLTVYGVNIATISDLGDRSKSHLSLNSQDQSNDLMQIGFGYRNSINFPAVIGYHRVGSGTHTNGDLIFATRSVTTDTAPSVRMRILADGTVRFGEDNALTEWGTAGDASIYYNASDFIIDSAEVGSGKTYFKENVTFEKDVVINGVLFGGSPQYIFAHNNESMPLITANVWQNVTFSQEATYIKMGISHVHNDATNITFTISESGIYDIDYDFDVIDTSPSASDIDVAGRVIFTNGTEILGSVFESDITKQNIEVEISHNFLARLGAGDEIVFQFVADDADVEISTHGTFGVHPESATIMIEKIANL